MTMAAPMTMAALRRMTSLLPSAEIGDLQELPGAVDKEEALNLEDREPPEASRTTEAPVSSRPINVSPLTEQTVTRATVPVESTNTPGPPSTTVTEFSPSVGATAHRPCSTTRVS